MSLDQFTVPLRAFYGGLNADERIVLYVILAIASGLGFLMGRRGSREAHRYRSFGSWRFPSFQNSSEQLIARDLISNFSAPDYHLMNHVTLQMEDGTTQVDHILLSRFGIFVIETKDYGGWIFANVSDKTWTNVRFRQRYTFQNPIHQNFRHVLAVQNLLEFIPKETIRSVVVFCGSAEFKTDMPDGVVQMDGLVDYLRQFSKEVIALNRLQYAVGRLETSRLALSGETDVEHIENLKRRFRNNS